VATSNQKLNSKTNIFPVEVFPLEVQQIIVHTKESLNFPNDFVGASMLYVASISIGNTHRAAFKNSWTESAVLYLALVSRAGATKSHPLSFVLKPIFEHDKKTFKEYEQQRQEYEESINRLKKEKEQPAGSELQKPIFQKILITDYTPEALAIVHKNNKKGIGVYIDELAGWFKNFNRYNKGSEMELWLSQWSGRPLIIDRKSGEPIFIPLPFISVAGTIQKGLLKELAKDSRTQNGFIDRILFAIPDNLKKEAWSENDLPLWVIENWDKIIQNLLKMSITTDETLNPEPEKINFTPQAKKALFEWQKANTVECNGAENEELSGIFSKMDMYVLRFALILEMLKYACNKSNKQAIGIDSVEGAIKLVNYFKKSAIKVNTILSNADPLEKYSADKQAVYNELPDNFTTEEGLKTAEKLNMPKRTFKRFLTDKELFINISWGKYEKCF
jgi:hypothetical protein